MFLVNGDGEITVPCGALLSNLHFVMYHVLFWVTIKGNSLYFDKSERRVHFLCRDKERMIARGHPCLPYSHLSESPKNFSNLPLSKSPIPVFRQNTVMTDHTVCRPRSRVERKEPHNIFPAPTQEGTSSDGAGIFEHISVEFLPIFLLGLPKLRVGPDKLGIALIKQPGNDAGCSLQGRCVF